MTTLDSIVVAQVDALLEGEPNPVTNLANASALLYNTMADLNWCGFYLYSKQTQTLDLGPFQGQVACMHIKPDSGVVGTSFASGQSLLVPDVHAFAGHIACDAASNSEVVVPVVVDGQCIGILDLDSPSLNRFTAADQEVLTAFAAALAKHLDAAALALVY
ncbi:GAF domain-containing protein [Lacticaseibacillus suihuaensis]